MSKENKKVLLEFDEDSENEYDRTTERLPTYYSYNYYKIKEDLIESFSESDEYELIDESIKSDYEIEVSIQGSKRLNVFVKDYTSSRIDIRDYGKRPNSRRFISRVFGLIELVDSYDNFP